MLVADPMRMLTEKFGAMLDYAQTTYPEDSHALDVDALRSLRAPVIAAVVRAHFLPHKDRIVRNDNVQEIIDTFPEQYRGSLSRAAEDEKLRRYMLLFIDLCA